MILRWVLLLLLIYLLLRIYLSTRRRPRNPRRTDTVGAGEEMVLDPQCQSYLPKSEALLRGGHYFCSDRCAQLYLAARSSN